MTDSTRAHRRLTQATPAGRRVTLSSGTLLLPPSAHASRKLPLLIHFHGAGWVAEQSARQWKRKAAVVAVEAGSGSAVYTRAMANPEQFPKLIEEAGGQFGPIAVSSFSAGYGAIREILKVRSNWKHIDAIVLADSLHSDLKIDDEHMQPFLEFAREAVAGRKRMLITHSEVFPGTFASTTQTADYILDKLGLRRRAVLHWGPLGMQQVSEVRSGRFTMLGFAGNSAPDHVDHLYALAWWLKRLKLR